MKISLRWKLLATYLYVVGLTVALLGGYLARRLGAEYVGELKTRLGQEAKLVAALESYCADGGGGFAVGAAVRCADAAESTGARVTFIAGDGTVVADSEAEAEAMGNHGSRPEVIDALDGQLGSDTRASATLERPFLYVAVPVRGGAGVVRLALPLDEVEHLVGGVTRATVATITVLVVLAVPLGLVWSKRLTEPLRAMVESTRRVGGGDLDTRVQWHGNDEIGELARGLNDMTARLQKTYADLAEQNRTFETVLARLRAGVIIADEKGNLTLANGAAAAMLGLEVQSALGRPFIHASLHYELDQALRRCLEQGVPVQVDAAIEGETGLAVEAMFAPALNGRGEVTMVVGVLHDVTERLRTDEMRREFVANASHELRTPAASIRAMAETLLAGGKSDPERLDRTLNLFLQESERLGKLIGDLLDLAEAERGDVRDRVPVSVKDTVDQVLGHIESRAGERRLALAAEVPAEIRVLSEPRRLEQVLTNLLENATNYTPEGGQIRLKAATVDSQVLVAIEDTGIGIAAEHLSRIFERFYRVDKARSRKTGGTGLGLAIVKHLVAVDGGDITVDSAVGTGSTFTVLYPEVPGD